MGAVKNELQVHMNNGNVLTILEGKAQVLPQPKKQTINGIITAPGVYAKTRELKPELAVVNVDYKSGTLQLIDDLYHEFNTTVNGSIIYDRRFLEFGVNTDKTFNRDSLFKLFRMYPHLFKDGDVYSKILYELKNKTWKISTQATSNDDRKGNTSKALDQNVEVPALSIDKFTLVVPIFEGDSPMHIYVEIYTQYENNIARFSLESTGLQEIIDTRMKEILDREIVILRDAIEEKNYDPETEKKIGRRQRTLCLIDVTGVV